MAHVGVILSGCGVFDGSEIHEATSALIALDARGASYTCLAPDTQFQVIDHTTQKPTGEKRSVLTEAARIARGEIKSLADANGADFDALVLPGGFGAAKNLCSFATEGAACSVDPQVERVLREAHGAGKPIGFICIAPAVGARVFGSDVHPKLTIGHDAGTAAGLEALGAQHVAMAAAGIVSDDEHRIVSTPAYMEASGPAEVFEGISKLVERVLELTGSPVSA
ncbi:MAG: glutamine amidotransferase [Phycisphaeraceae bacterium]|nr:MAG: glutamine amidotransferase [Phycisphaeraceae bacterium]